MNYKIKFKDKSLQLMALSNDELLEVYQYAFSFQAYQMLGIDHTHTKPKYSELDCKYEILRRMAGHDAQSMEELYGH